MLLAAWSWQLQTASPRQAEMISVLWSWVVHTSWYQMWSQQEEKSHFTSSTSWSCSNETKPLYTHKDAGSKHTDESQKVSLKKGWLTKAIRGNPGILFCLWFQDGSQTSLFSRAVLFKLPQKKKKKKRELPFSRKHLWSQQLCQAG